MFHLSYPMLLLIGLLWIPTSVSARTIYVFQGTASTATLSLIFPCGGACDDPNPPAPTDLTRSELVTDYTEVDFEFRFLLEDGPAQFEIYEGAWGDSRFSIEAASATTTESLFYVNSALDSVTQTNESNASESDSLYAPTGASAPTFTHTYATGRGFFSPKPSDGNTLNVGGLLSWDVSGPPTDPHQPAPSTPISILLGNPFDYLDKDNVATERERRVVLTGVTNVTLTKMAGESLDPAVPVLAPVAAVGLLLGGLGLGWIRLRAA